MGKRYSRKQIEQAIKHWQSVLKRIDESKSPLLDACSRKFGEDVVFGSKDMLFNLNEDNIMALFAIIDKFVFESRLKTLDNLKVFVGNPSVLNKAILQYSNNEPIDLKNYFALYRPDQYIYRNPPVIGKYVVDIKKNGIFINTETHRTSTFSYAASCLCHEMIHVYDMHFGKLYAYLVWAINNGAPVWAIDQNSHETSVYKSKKREFEMKTNIPIEDYGNNYSFEKFNDIASKDIALLRENAMSDDNIVPYVFSKKIQDLYKDTSIVGFGDNGYFSFSFGIPMPS